MFMTPARFQTIEEIYRAALGQEREQVSAFLGGACGGDEVLRRKVEALLSSRERAENFIETSAIGVAAKIIQNGQADSFIGQTIGHYKILESIGTGGMGDIYLATDIVAGRKAALKLLPLRFTGDAARLKRFAQEAHAVVALNHPNILTVYEIGEDHSIHYIASELIEGETLRQRLMRGRMEPREAVDVAIQVTSALVAAHEAGIVHRDVKPENIMLRPDSYVKVLDFGIAKLAEERLPVTMSRDEALLLVETNLGSILGTVRYMSPEQACGAQVDQRTDIWSLGIVLYEMVTGHAPFTGNTPKEVMSSILEKEPLPLAKYLAHAPADLQQIISKMLRKDRSQRYHSAHELLQALKDLRRKLDAELERATAPLWLRWARSPAALVLVLTIAALVVALPFYRHRDLTTSLPPDKSIAVLPAKAINSANRDEIYQIGIADSLILKLGSMNGFVIRPLSVMRKYAGDGQDPLSAGREQKADYVLASNYQLEGGKIHITAQLLNVASGKIEEVYKSKKDAADIFAMQDAIASEVGNVLSARFGTTLSGRTAKRGTASEEAYRLYLQGMYLSGKRTPADAHKAVEVLEQSLRLDPKYAQAWAGLAQAHKNVVTFAGSKAQEEYRKSIEAINTALALDENLADAHCALCVHKMSYQYDFDGAERECKRAIELDPNSSQAHSAYSRYLNCRGRFDEGIDEIKTAIDLEPASLVNQRDYGVSLYYARRYADAVTQLKRVIGMDEKFVTTYNWLVVALEMQGKYPEAFEWWIKLQALDKKSLWCRPGEQPEGAIQAFQTAYQTSGWKGLMLERTRRCDEASLMPNYPGPYFQGAIEHAKAGHKDKAFERLEKSYQKRESWMNLVKVEPGLDSLRDDPRFDELVTRVGLNEPKNRVTLTTTVPTEKSIAVLPFENLSKDEENAFFAAGMQDEILTNLAKVADLKVISRTSVMKYKSGLERNLREIARTLGVSHVVEGSVQRAGGRVRVSAQLIDARNDTHIWAEHYDRDVADVFAVQTEIAQQIADQLKVNLSPAEKAAIAERPTTDLVAYAYYTKAKEIDIFGNWEGVEKSLKQKVELLEKATQRDASFALAYCALAQAQCDLFLATAGELADLSRTRLESAKKAADAALRIRPDLGEAHLELARYYFCAGDFDRARDELTISRRKLPNNSEALYIAARIDRRQNRWDDSLANYQKASELDPRNAEAAFWRRDTYFEARRYSELEQLITKDAAGGTPQDPWTELWLAMIKLAKGDPVTAQALLEQVPLDFSPTHWIWETRFTAALYLRGYDAASRVIAATPVKFVDALGGQAPESWPDGQVARARGDKQKALAAFAAERKRLDQKWQTQVKDERYLMQIAALDAGLDRKEEAIREARRAVDLRPIIKDSLQGPEIATRLALVYAWTGERDRALEQLEIVAKIPAGPTYGDLLLNPCWDDLRGDKRFDKVVAAAKAASR
jgi:eukaryotic-like serine/threonine-protein kinase